MLLSEENSRAVPPVKSDWTDATVMSAPSILLGARSLKQIR